MPKTYEGYSVDGPNQHKANGFIRTEVAKARFLELFACTGHFQKTCDILGLVPRTVYSWKKTDKEFMEKYEEADAMALQMLEDEAFRRASMGTEKPVYQQGRLVGYTREYSDTLMIVLLKARAPHKYKDRFAGELTGADGRPLLPEVKILHVHSEIPLANNENELDMERKPSGLQDSQVGGLIENTLSAMEQTIPSTTDTMSDEQSSPSPDDIDLDETI